LNNLGIDTSRTSMETSDEYEARMKRLIQEMQDKDFEQIGLEYVNKEFINHMKQLNIPLHIINSVDKSIMEENDGISIKYWTITNWTKLKKSFVDDYGNNPFRLTATDIYNFIMKLREKSNLKSTSTIDTDFAESKPLFENVATTNHFFKSNTTKSHIKNLYVVDKNKVLSIIQMDGLMKRLEYDYNDDGNLRKIGGKQLTAMLGERSGDNSIRAEFEELFGNFNTKVSQADLYDMVARSLNKLPVYQNASSSSSSSVEDIENVDEAEQSGHGFRSLGSKKINYNALMSRNKLVITQPSLTNIYGYPVQTVSDRFVSFINRVLDKKNLPTETEIDLLTTTEANLFRRILNVTGINKFHDAGSIRQLKQRLTLIQDEIGAGNNNTHLLLEAKQILNTLSRQNVITWAENRQFIKQLSKKIDALDG